MPIIIWGSTLVLKLIDRFPSVVIGGAALLGWIAGGMLVTDIKIVEWFFANGGTVADSNSALALVPSTVKYGAEIAGAIFVVAVGLLWAKSKKSA